MPRHVAAARADGLIREVRAPASAWRPSRPAGPGACFVPADALGLVVRAARSDAPWRFPLFARIFARRRWRRRVLQGDEGRRR